MNSTKCKRIQEVDVDIQRSVQQYAYSSSSSNNNEFYVKLNSCTYLPVLQKQRKVGTLS
jgi:hypothetical protein